MPEYIWRRVFPRGVLFKIVEEVTRNREFLGVDERKDHIIRK